MIAGTHAVLWLRQDSPGNDACRFADAQGGYLIDGSATDADWNVVRYRVRARDDGTTRRARIGAHSRIFVRRAPDDTWTVNGADMPAVDGAQDIDFAFTPATLTLPIRRLKLAVGEEAEVTAASLDLADEQLRPLHRIYRRIDADTYECRDTDTGKSAELKVGAQNIVREYPGRWKAQK